nr:hypothetical protein C4D60_Mb02t03040 [Ipomoea batatas]
MTRLIPLTYLDSSLARYNAASATSFASILASFKFAISHTNSSTISFSSIPMQPLSIGVATPNGDTQFTLTPYLPISTPKFFAKPTTACFDAEYSCGTSPYVTEATLEVKITLPFLAGIMTRAACFAHRKAPNTLASNTLGTRIRNPVALKVEVFDCTGLQLHEGVGHDTLRHSVAFGVVKNPSTRSLEFDGHVKSISLEKINHEGDGLGFRNQGLERIAKRRQGASYLERYASLDLDLPVLGHGGVHRVFHVGFASHVAVHVGNGVVPNFVTDGAAQLVLDIRNDHLRPVPDKMPRRTFANPAGPTRYHSNFAR